MLRKFSVILWLVSALQTAFAGAVFDQTQEKANSGDTDALYYLGYMYEKGLDGVEKNLQTAYGI